MEARTKAFRLCLLLMAVAIAGSAHADSVKSPSCDELAAWASTIDARDRWAPFPENERMWLPRAMESPAFESLFGKPALEWSHADVASARAVWNGCIKTAKRARNREQQTVLSKSRSYLTSNLRNAVRYEERRTTSTRASEERTTQARQQEATSAKARQRNRPGPVSALDRNVAELVAQPASLDAFLALGLLSRLDVRDSDALSKLERRFGAMSGTRSTSSAYRILRELRIRGTDDFETSALPKINARLLEVKQPVLGALTEEFSQNPADPDKRRALAQRYEKVMADLEEILPHEEWRALADHAREARQAIINNALAEAKSDIDRTPTGKEGIAMVDQIIKRFMDRGPDAKQRKELIDHARTRQRILADAWLASAVETDLPAIPETWAGIAALDKLNRGLVTANQWASPEAKRDFATALHARLAEVGRKATPEFERQLAALPETEEGLAKAEEWVAHTHAWHVMEESVRRDYQAVAEARRNQIAVVVKKERAAQKAAVDKERQEALAAGADPRIVGYQWIDSNNTMKLDFRDEETVFVSALGFKFAGTYKISRDDVVVTGPHGQLVYTIEGETLVGNGAVFRKSGLR